LRFAVRCRDDRDSPPSGPDRAVDELSSLVDGQRLIFAGAAADDDRIRFGIDLEFDQPAQGVEINRTGAKRGYQRNPRP
jgi:hypothetical protein